MEERIMKKHMLLFAAFGAFLALSCNKEVSPDTPSENGMKKVTISATINDELTKTSYENGTTFSWTAGDEISVLCSDGNFYTFTADKTGATSTFSGSIPADEHLGAYAFFPADDAHAYSGLKFNIPEYKDLTSHPSADMPMVGDKGDDDNYSFMHCCGASLFTLTNIPDKIKSVTVSFVSASLKLSGLFGVFTSSGEWRWNADGGSNDSEKTFSRKVSVKNGNAEVYLPYAWGAQMWANNTVNVIGHDASNKEYALITDKKMKGSSSYTYARAHVQPLKPLIIGQLNFIDWSANEIVTSTLDEWQTATVALTELKVTADDYYMYVRVKGPSSAITQDNYLDIDLSDGKDGEYVWGDYWRTTGSVIYRKEHKGPVTASSFTMTFNGISVDTAFETSGDDIYWYMAIPRSAHELLSSSGTIYVGACLWEGWGITGCIPSKRTWDHESYLMSVSLP